MTRLPIRSFCAALFLSALPLGADPDPLRFDHVLEIDDLTIPVPMELYLTPRSQTVIHAKVAGNLAQLQRHLPALLSDVAQDDCTTRIAVQTDDAIAQGDGIRARGRVQIQQFLCNRDNDFDSRVRIFNHVTTVDLLLVGGIANDCLDARLDELELNPSGLVGGVLNITGLTRRIQETVRTELNEILNSEENCLEMPEALQVLNTRVERGGFRDFGDGELGFVIQGTVDLQSQNVIDLLALLYEEGLLDPP